MATEYSPYLKTIDASRQQMTSLLLKWTQIPSESDNILGLSFMLDALKEEFIHLGGVLQEIPLEFQEHIGVDGKIEKYPIGAMLSIRKHWEAPIQVLLVGHMDVVPAQDFIVNMPEENRLQIRGAADMKGGLIVLYHALLALENSIFAGKIGWEILITPDEEIGSPGSTAILEKRAREEFDIGLIFEPAFADGALVDERKGSANYTLIVRGVAAHAGRDPHAGCNAISSIMPYLKQIEELGNREKGITVNIGILQAGEAVNVVPDLAICKFNLRMHKREEMEHVKRELQRIVNQPKSDERITVLLYADSERAPKPMDEATQNLINAYTQCGKDIGLKLQFRTSGGVTDGNTLAGAGLPTLDSLGPVGGNLHSPEEYVLLNSLPERSKLAALFLMKLANGEIVLPKER